MIPPGMSEGSERWLAWHQQQAAAIEAAAAHLAGQLWRRLNDYGRESTTEAERAIDSESTTK
jgi:hypothetical protein